MKRTKRGGNYRIVTLLPYVWFECPKCKHRQVVQIWKTLASTELREKIPLLTCECENCGKDFTMQELKEKVVAVSAWRGVAKGLSDAEGYFALLYLLGLENLPEDPEKSWLSKCGCSDCKQTRKMYQKHMADKTKVINIGMPENAIEEEGKVVVRYIEE